MSRSFKTAPVAKCLASRMVDSRHVIAAAASLREIVDAIDDDALHAPTPCTDYDVRALVNHLLFWGPSLEGAARKQLVSPPAADETAVDLTVDEWRTAFETQLDRTTRAWSEPAAWDGVTRMGGPMELPATVIGAMLLGEFVVHGWDLARATGQQPAWADDLLEYLYDETAKTAEQGRQMGIYGPEVPVPADAPDLDRILGLTGRDPAWTP